MQPSSITTNASDSPPSAERGIRSPSSGPSWTAVARQRLERRARERNDPSDASMQIREHQQKLLRDIPLRIPEGALAATVDTGVDGPASLDPLLTVLDAAGAIGALLPDRTMIRA
ncbi:MAG: hypothetical protein M9947_07655 [Thermomicrobiales bacterium]|nr:hypothetical protein [Thermomicrobiales bacterium]